jgi:hypothetical protein
MIFNNKKKPDQYCHIHNIYVRLKHDTDICTSDLCPFFIFSNRHSILKFRSFIKFSNRHPILKSMAISHFFNSTADDVTDVCPHPNQLNLPQIWEFGKDVRFENTRAHPHLQKIGRLDFSLRDHEGEVKAWQGDFQQHHRDMFLQKCGFFHFFFFLHLKCVFANILLISFILNIKFMFCICFIIIIDLIFIDFTFIHFCLEICQWHLNVRFLPPISYVPMIAVFKPRHVDCLAFKKLQITQVLWK